MEKLYTNTTFQINQLIEKISTGELGLPELQRPFLWENSKIRDLFDSLIRGFPIGTLMLWDSSDIKKIKIIGTNKKSSETPRQVIIDGQQRLTSLFAVFTGTPVLDKNYVERNVIISYYPLKNKFEVATSATKRDPECIYNITDIYTTNSHKLITAFIKKLKEYRISKGNVLTNREEEEISTRIADVESLKQTEISVVDIKNNAEDEVVSEIFVRVNSSGTPLKQNDFILTLISLYWADGRKLIEKFCIDSIIPQKGTEKTSYNKIIPIEAQDIIRVVMAYAFDRARLKYGYKLLRGEDFDNNGVVDKKKREERFSILKNKLYDVINTHIWHEFLKSVMNAGYYSKKTILSDTAIFYSYALYLIANKRFGASNNENRALTSLWIYYSLLVSLYAGSFESTFENQLSGIKECKNYNDYRDFILGRVEQHLTNDYFDINLIGTNGLDVASNKGNNAWFAYVAALNILNTNVLFSKSNIKLSILIDNVTNGNRASLEVHHLFPKAYLKSKGYKDNKINQMANFAYIDWNDNAKILDDAPSKYYPIICKNMKKEDVLSMEEDNALPHGWEKMKYDDFLKERRKLMAKKIKQAYLKLKQAIK